MLYFKYKSFKLFLNSLEFSNKMENKLHFFNRRNFKILLDEGGWWHGRLKGKAGLFPSNYVEKI